MTLLHSGLLRGANAAAHLFGPRLPHDADELILAAAPELNGADRALVRDPLDTLLRACLAEADLSPLGRGALRFDAARHLANVQRLAVEEALAPAILHEPITAPLFITGLPRSGTTFLHRLLAADPAVRAPRAWQMAYPYPDAEGPDRRLERVQRQLDGFALLAPELRNVHPIDAASPQECTEITAQVFRSLRFETVYRIPAYKAWLAAYGHHEAYRFHRRFLQHLQHQERGNGMPPRWVLKCPDHVFALPALRAVYPDAHLIFLHRDPLKVLPSVAQLTEILRAPFTRSLDRLQIGQQVLDDWVNGTEIMLAEKLRPASDTRQVLHLGYLDVVRRPLETIAMIYDHFGLTLTDTARAAMAAYVAEQPRGGYGANRYSFDRHGLDPAELRARFANYMAQFGVAEEGNAAAKPSRPTATARPTMPLAAPIPPTSHAGP